jgi:glycosyltransferase involved in cell wall biosynthesis
MLYKIKKLSSLTIFFPFFNDEGTVCKLITDAYYYGQEVAQDLEVIAIHGGCSKDNTYREILRTKKIFPSLIILNKIKNKDGYAVIRHGFKKASKKWVFYTDGDAQYHLNKDLKRLVDAQNRYEADVVNGYKKKRHDDLVRIFLGKGYAWLCRLVFNLPIRDIDCDFRLIKKNYIQKISLVCRDSSILPELIKKLQFAGAKIKEIPVSHYPRIYGKSNYNIPKLIMVKLVSGYKLFWMLRKYSRDFGSR